ncbi:hypothetical protein JZ751_026599 [Albula glossodonta]|uniref:VWFA domain-containing protein n=1 Tax=Albula glossodonta TaxID=121402 RepID=A0A8T2PCK0_9TELE|nr:hypothetical protein JZ751_026599 [Albula glossodonta]
MEKMSPLSLLSVLISLAAIVPVFLSFTIDDVHTKTFTGKTSNTEYFGYKALQFKNESAKWIVVSAPMKRNGTGGLYQCSPQRGDCQPFYFAEEDSAKSTGMALASKSTGPTQITACSHSLAHECDSNSYLNGLCYQFNDQLMLKNNITAAYQECTKGKVDLVFLFDGSESLKAEDFQKNKQFIIDIMKSFSNTSIQFAAVQFSKFFSTVFTFKDYHTNEAWDLLSKEVHMKSLTNTYGAINYVLEKILYNATAGAIPDATKVLVIITDGTPTELDYYKSVPALDERTIIRYVIGVGKVDLQTLSHLASEPKANSTFKIYDYNGLTNILDGLQKKIFNIEGTQNKLGKTFKNEMSQSGFSAVYLKDTLILGTVGSNNWRGSLIEVGPESVYHEITDPQMEEDSYMGYSVEVGRKSNKDLYFSGAPRYQHTGQVLVFHQTNGNWTVAETKKGEQIGEYFGAVLCAVDIDSDGETDFLLVGAPLYHGSQSEGRMFVYNLTAQVT